jgi:two-component system LytT family sensor kinase
VIANKVVVIGIGIVLTALIYLAIAAFGRDRSIGTKAVIACLASLIASGAMAGTLIAAEDMMRESKEEMRWQAREGFVIVERGHTIRIERRAEEPLVMTLPRLHELDPYKKLRYAADTSVVWLFFFVAWSAFYLAWVAQAEALGARRRAAEAEAAAQSAQVRALRYQVNPHFLFNTLNSLSSLVLTGKTAAAERMIQTMATFYRRSLAADPTGDVPLSEEFDLQRLYLYIETARFPKRLEAKFELPDALAEAMIPGMILQPLVENSVKHAVAPSSGKVAIAISAREEYGRLVVTVADDGASRRRSAEPRPGFGIGLGNVQQRLAARFGDEASVVSGPTSDGYATHIRLPLIGEKRAAA